VTLGEKSALYVYGFTWADDTGEFSEPGVGGASDVVQLPMGEIAAIVSPLNVEEFLGPEGEDRTQDMDWVAPRALRHERVVEEVMRTSPILPLTFGVVFSSRQALFDAVEGHGQKIAEFLEYTADKQEWAVKGFADPRKVRESLERSMRFQERLEGLPQSPGARYFQEKRLELELERRIAPESRDMAEQILQDLAPSAVAVQPLRLSARELTGRGDDMVLNVAFLERVDQLDAFVEQVQRLADVYQPRGVTIEVTGPWPPYSFCPKLQVEP
jgi:hypothetical protein